MLQAVTGHDFPLLTPYLSIFTYSWLVAVPHHLNLLDLAVNPTDAVIVYQVTALTCVKGHY